MGNPVCCQLLVIVTLLSLLVASRRLLAKVASCCLSLLIARCHPFHHETQAPLEGQPRWCPLYFAARDELGGSFLVEPARITYPYGWTIKSLRMVGGDSWKWLYHAILIMISYKPLG